MSTGTDARIHNIGYRSYTGERLGISYARRALFTHSLRGSFGLGRSARSKVLPMGLFGIMAAPALVMVAIAAFVGLDELPIEYTSYALFMQPIVGLYIALAAPQMVSLDLRYKVTPLYFSRPIERGDYVAAKYAALSSAIFLFVALPLVIAYIGGLLAELGFADQTKGFAQGLVISVVFALLHAAIALWVASLTPRRGFGVAAVIGVLTIPYFAVTALQAVAYDAGSEDALGWIGIFSPGSVVDGIQSAFLGGTSSYPFEEPPTDVAGVALLATAVLVTVACYLLLGRRYRKAGL
ncbi:ABC-2 type transport system permease protein [Streptomyces zhaozhouensis]|uniref:ABC-2 type transport system permease protein n=1 Tax=Streptomyces zhaozhouensis TaxID=1300267 RepID=A0A286DYF1_9ACTN|nr:ABC transporter permease subunit [Streptomyces zhaozhouensis]SOD63707.1 ABC-2 type transport system permease protein [Streptomyces zhaozhouensis]